MNISKHIVILIYSIYNVNLNLVDLLGNSTFLNFIKYVVSSFGILSIPLMIFLLLLIYMLYKWFNNKMNSDINDIKKKNDDMLNIILTHISKDDDSINTKNLSNNTKIHIDDMVSNKNKINMYLGVDKDLTKHPIFNNINYILNVKMKSVSLSSKLKKDVFLDMTALKLNIIKNEWLIFFKNLDIDNDDKENIKQNMINVIYQINSNFDTIVLENNIPDIIKNVINKSSIQIDDIIITTIKYLFESYNNKDIYYLIYTLLTYYMIIIETSLYHIITNINELNGELDDLKYEVKFYKI